MKIAIGSDHAGYEMKEKVKQHLQENGLSVLDFGTNSPESVDYPDFIHPECEKPVLVVADHIGSTSSFFYWTFCVSLGGLISFSAR